jgi:hypothetical protein
MSTVNPTTLNLSPAKAATATPQQRKVMLRQACQEMVGQTFFGEMLKMARNSKLKGTIGHGGRGEEVFGGQLDQEMSKLAGSAMKNSLSDAIYTRLVKNI